MFVPETICIIFRISFSATVKRTFMKILQQHKLHRKSIPMIHYFSTKSLITARLYNSQQNYVNFLVLSQSDGFFDSSYDLSRFVMTVGVHNQLNKNMCSQPNALVSVCLITQLITNNLSNWMIATNSTDSLINTKINLLTTYFIVVVDNDVAIQ